MKNNYTGLLSFLFLLFSVLVINAQDYVNGVFILNEGGAGSSNASVSFLPNEGNLQNNIFGTVNPAAGPMGDTAQSMAFNGDYAYVILNISNSIRVVNRSTFELVATINTGLNNPRYMAFSNGKGYVTCWGNGGSATDDYIAVIDLTDNSIETTILAPEGVERILENNGNLYVAHQGGYGYGSTISVINSTTNTITETIQVGDVPNSIIIDNGILYVLCGGRPIWASPQTFGSFHKINLADFTIIEEYEFTAEHPSNLKMDNSGNLYFSIDGGVYKTTITDFDFPASPLFSLGPQNLYGIYGMDIIDDVIYVGDAVNYVSPGKVSVFSTTGTLLQELIVGVCPNSFYKAVETDLGIDDNFVSKLSVYPNPTADIFYLNTSENAQIKMYDNTGKLVKDQNYSSNGIPVSDLNKGIYIVEIVIADKRHINKLIIK